MSTKNKKLEFLTILLIICCFQLCICSTSSSSSSSPASAGEFPFFRWLQGIWSVTRSTWRLDENHNLFEDSHDHWRYEFRNHRSLGIVGDIKYSKLLITDDDFDDGEDELAFITSLRVKIEFEDSIDARVAGTWYVIEASSEIEVMNDDELWSLSEETGLKPLFDFDFSRKGAHGFRTSQGAWLSTENAGMYQWTMAGWDRFELDVFSPSMSTFTSYHASKEIGEGGVNGGVDGNAPSFWAKYGMHTTLGLSFLFSRWLRSRNNSSVRSTGHGSATGTGESAAEIDRQRIIQELQAEEKQERKKATTQEQESEHKKTE